MSKRILLVCKILLKLVILNTLLIGFAVDYINTDEIDQYLHYIYGFTMFVCSFSFGATFFMKYKQIAYIAFFCSFAIVLLMNKISPIKITHDSISCLETGQGVWDYEQNICRTDCWRWDKEHGCYKHTEEQ